MVQLTGIRTTYAGIVETGELIGMTADELDTVSRVTLWNSLTEIVTFIEGDLLPYLVAEEEVLYPAVRAATASPTCTETIRVDHDEVVRLDEELAVALRSLLLSEPAAIGALRRVLYALHAVIRLHVRAEEEILLPVLEPDLDQHQADKIESSMRIAAANVAGPARSRVLIDPAPVVRSAPRRRR